METHETITYDPQIDRKKFAAAALSGLLANYGGTKNPASIEASEVARAAFLFADAMVETMKLPSPLSTVRMIEDFYPAELPCPLCQSPSSIGRYGSKDVYHCVSCGADISGPNWKKLR